MKVNENFNIDSDFLRKDGMRRTTLYLQENYYDNDFFLEMCEKKIYLMNEGEKIGEITENSYYGMLDETLGLLTTKMLI